MVSFEVNDEFVKWKTYSNENLLSRFSASEWKEIAADISSVEEWKDFLSTYSEYVQCYVLENITKSTDIAFAYLYKESSKVISIHGGGWLNPLLYYRGYILLIRRILENGYKVRTSCNLCNPAAIRFSRSAGFIPYNYTSSKVYMWISERTLKRTFLYKRFYSDTI